jgi:iodotyrosine deiodinase
MPELTPYDDHVTYPPEEMLLRARAFLGDIRRRRSIRDFSERPVAREVIEACLLAAGSAPSGANMQPWHFAVIADPAARRRLRVAAEAEERAFYQGRATPDWLDALAPLGTDADKPHLEHAPVVIAVFAQRHGTGSDGGRVRHYYVPESVGIATGFLLVALHRAGLATLVHTPSPMGFLNEICGRPPGEKPYLLVIAGHPAEGCKTPADARRKKTLGLICSWV